MEREILFRGKRKDDGEWAYGSLLNLGGRYFIVPNEELEPDENTPFPALYWASVRRTCEVDPKTVGQYTGLTDKNGTMIFEGDVPRYGVVGFAEGGFTMGGQWPIDHEIWGGQFRGEVLGNIHDNPELRDKGILGRSGGDTHE